MHIEKIENNIYDYTYTLMKSKKNENYVQRGRAGDNPSEVKLNKELSITFFKGKCTDIAKSLLGNVLITKTPEGIAGGIIVETEAYLGMNDPACHLSHGVTKRNESFYNGSGTLYIFKIHRYNNLNVISEYNSHPECILLRALEPTHGLELMKRRRGTDTITDLTTGPGKLTDALGITKEESNNKRINTGTIFIFTTTITNVDTVTTTRIGISKATDWPLRYYIKNNPFVSKNSKKETTVVSSFDEARYYEFLSRPVM
jgi:DNA-3-methyladenine glycosylase